MMYHIGDIILADIYVGVVVGVSEDKLTCNCSDGQQHVFNVTDAMMVTSYKDMLESFRRGIMTNVSG